MAKHVDINCLQPHTVSEVICVKCGYRWISVRPSKTRLKDLQCPNCKYRGYTIETGEIIEPLTDEI